MRMNRWHYWLFLVVTLVLMYLTIIHMIPVIQGNPASTGALKEVNEAALNVAVGPEH